MLGVEIPTLRRWQESGELVPDRRSAGGTRYYDVAKILGLGNEDMPTIGYARVASRNQKNDLVRQQELLEAFCAAKGWRHEVIAELGSGLNDRKKDCTNSSRCFCTSHPSAGADPQGSAERFGSELICALCELQNIEIIIINKGEPPTAERPFRQGQRLLDDAATIVVSRLGAMSTPP